MNRLAQESSPYLRQHADNPVDWYPWSTEAFDLARSTDRPVLLSVGYSSCHWCHVMAHESFDDPATAEIMNRDFVNVKVDREELPEVDALYMGAVQAMTGSGGWPMTVFLDVDGRPFAGGTYFPRERTGPRPSFTEVLERIRTAWTEERPEVDRQAEQLTRSLERSVRLRPTVPSPSVDPSEWPISTIDRAVSLLRQRYDATWGGYGTAPKFPQTMSHEILLRVAHRTGESELVDLVTNSLDAMASGGIYDHLGGGFARYSTDRQWLLPHFEKMLDANALLIQLYLHAWQVTGRERYLQVVEESIAYLLRDLRHRDGGFFSAEDADSEGQEGKFYLWTHDQIHSVLGDAPDFDSWYGVTADGNLDGRCILWRPVRGDLIRPVGVELCRQRLFAAREMRIRPGLDDKVVCEWNGLAIAALAEAALATANHQWLAAATRAAEFLLANMRRADGRWLRSWHERDETRGSEHRRPAVANDLAAVIDGFTRLAEASGESRWIEHATDAARQLLALFWDDEHGGIFTSGTDADHLVVRSKDLTDDSAPSANSLAATALLRLGVLTDTPEFTRSAHRIIEFVAPLMEEHPTAFAHLLGALDQVATGFSEIVVPGDVPDLLDTVRVRYLPNSVLAWGEPYESPLWHGRDRGIAYVCRAFSCLEPAHDAATLATQLDGLVER